MARAASILAQGFVVAVLFALVLLLQDRENENVSLRAEAQELLNRVESLQSALALVEASGASPADSLVSAPTPLQLISPLDTGELSRGLEVLPPPRGVRPSGAFSVVGQSIERQNGEPYLRLRIKNEGDLVIDAFDVKACFWDAYGDPVGGSDNCTVQTVPETHVPPGEEAEFQFWLFLYDHARTAEVTPVRSHTTTGSTWHYE